MYEGKSHTLFAKYAIPQMIGLLFNSVYMIVDGVFIGNVLGRDAMAAAAVAVPLIEILIAISMAVASGAGIIISGQLARNEKEQALQVFDTCLLYTSPRRGRSSKQTDILPDVRLFAAMRQLCPFKPGFPAKLQPGRAVVIWKGGATECVRSDF